MTYQVSQCFTWSKWIKQMNQHGLDGCLMLQISLIKASSANDSTGSIPNLIHPWSVWLSNLSIIINQITNWKSTISQLLMMDGSINQSTRRSIPISQSPNLPTHRNLKPLRCREGSQSQRLRGHLSKVAGAPADPWSHQHSTFTNSEQDP